MPKLRPGWKDYFPPDDYIEMMRVMIDNPHGVATYKELASKNMSKKDVGIKLNRMIIQEVIKKKSLGVYQITPYGRKLMNAISLFRAAMN